jgi:hypothetical protein
LSVKVTMYETGGPVGVVVVVVAEVVPYWKPAAVVSVVEEDASVEVVSVVDAPVVSVEDAPVVSVVDSEVVSVADVVVSVPVTVSITWPNAPEATNPSTNSTVMPSANFTFRCLNVRRNFSLPWCALRRITLSPGYDRPSLARPLTREEPGCVPGGQVKLVLISCPQLVPLPLPQPAHRKSAGITHGVALSARRNGPFGPTRLHRLAYERRRSLALP